MPLTAAQLCTYACQIAKAPGLLTTAGDYLNQILLELTQEYDLDVAKNTATVTISPSGSPNAGIGPYSLPSNYLRGCSRDLTYQVFTVPYILTQITLAQFDVLINQQGIASYPTSYATDVSTSPPSLFVYPPPSQTFSIQVRYWGTMPEIATPSTSSTVPWFPNQNYLKVRLAGEMLRDTDDPRWKDYLGDGPQGAMGILRRFLNLQGDTEDTVRQVQLDRRCFGPGGGPWPPSKVTGGV